MQETVLILDFGSQYTQLIARRVRELNVYCEIHPYNKIPDLGNHIKGVILSGSPSSVHDPKAPQVDLSQFRNKIPVLGVCYGAQYMVHVSENGEVRKSDKREYGRANLRTVDENSRLFENIGIGSQVWMSHGDTIFSFPYNARIVASTADVDVAGYSIDGEETYGIQFHPEVFHTTDGKQLLQNFIVDICGYCQDWTPHNFVEMTVQSLKEKLGDDKVLLGLSGGVDSSVAAMLLHK